MPNLFFGGDEEVFIGRDYKTHQNYSENIAAIIDKEIQNIINTNYKRALEVLKENKDIVDEMVKLLFERETIYSDEVDMLIARKPLSEINEYIDNKLKKQEELDNNNVNKSAYKPFKEITPPEKNDDSPTAAKPAGQEQKENSRQKRKKRAFPESGDKTDQKKEDENADKKKDEKISGQLL